MIQAAQRTMWALTSTPVLGPLLVLLYGVTAASCLVSVLVIIYIFIIINNNIKNVIITNNNNNDIIRLATAWW